MFRVFLLLAVMATVSAFAFFDLEKRDVPIVAPSDTCAGRMSSCFRNGQVEQFGANHHVSDLARASVFRTFCAAVQVDAPCDKAYVARCGSERQDDQFDILAMNREFYLNMCNSNLSLALEREADSVCVTSRERRRMLVGMVFRCIHGMRHDLIMRATHNNGRETRYSLDGMDIEFLREHGCPLLDGLKSCAVNSVTMMCGSRIGAAASGVIDSYTGSFQKQVQCPVSYDRSSYSTALPGQPPTKKQRFAQRRCSSLGYTTCSFIPKLVNKFGTGMTCRPIEIKTFMGRCSVGVRFCDFGFK